MNRTDYPTVLGGQILACEAARNNEIVGTAGLPGIAELHALYSRRLYKTIVAITKNHEDAEDILQDTFLRAHLALHTFEGRSSIYSWLTRIAMNAALMILRKRRARAEILFDPQPDSGVEAVCFEVKDTGPNPEEACDLRRRQARLLEAIGKLSPGLREPIQMRMTQDCSLKEIGCALNLSEAAVKSRLHRARVRLSGGNYRKKKTNHYSASR